MQSKIAYFVAGAWIIAIFLLVFFGIRSEFRRRKMLKNGIRTKAIVIDNKVDSGQRRENRTNFHYTPVVSFKLENGDRVEAKRRYSTTTRHYEVGDVLYIYYSKENPNKFVFEAGKERKENLMITGILLIFVVFFLIGTYLLTHKF